MLLTLLLVVSGIDVTKGQCTAPLRVYADSQSHGNSSVLIASSSVDNPTSAIGANLGTDATILNVVTLLGSAEAWTELKFTNTTNPLLPLPSGTTTYVKIGGTSAASLLNLIGGSSLPVYAYYGATSTFTENGTRIPSNNVTVTNLTTPDGTIYLAITPNVPYNAVRIALNASVLVGTGKLLVYHAFYQGEGASCDPSLGASTVTSGLLTLGGGITNPNNAIDGNLSSPATFSMGIAGLGTTLKETVYFPGPSMSNDAATITFSIPPSLLVDLSLLNNISMTPYNGSTAGTPASLSSLLSLDLLSLLRTNNIVTVSLVPSTTFDRIEISMGSLLSLLAQMNLYEVQRTPGKPTFTAPESANITTCYGQSVTLSATTSPCNELHWYTVSSGGTAVVGATYTTGNLTTETTYYVASAKSGCLAESERIAIKVAINHVSLTPGSLSVCQDELNVLFPYILPICDPTEYKITWDNSNFIVDPSFNTLPANSIPITIPDRTKVGPGIYTGKLTVKNVTEMSPEIPIQITIKTTPRKPSVSIQ